MPLIIFHIAVCLLLGLLSTQADGTVFISLTDAGLRSSYDFIVIGAGTAGSVVATRLTEDPSISVLLIEAGVTNVGILDVEVPLLCTTLTPDTPLAWNYTTTPQVGYNGRSVALPRGRLLGGSSSVNYMTYSRGSQDDYNRFANLTDDQGWSWDAIQPYILKNEQFVQSADHHNRTGQYDTVVHGTSGPLKVSLPGFALPIDQLVLDTTKQLPSQFPFILDNNAGNTIGVGYMQSTINTYERSSSATAYLEAFAISRSNFHLLINTTATQIISNGTENGKVSFNAVKMAQSSNGTSITVFAKKDIILSAGSIASPQLMQLSGIGNSTALAELGIRTVLENPEVGQNLQDHPFIANQWVVSGTDTFDATRYNATLAADQLNQWITTHTGPLVDSPGNTYGFFKVPPSERFPDPSAGPTSGNYEQIYVNGFISETQTFPTSGFFFSVITAVVSPKSRGYVTLQSADPFDFPLIDPAYFTDPFDIHAATQSIKAAQEFVAAPAWSNYIVEPYGPNTNLTTDAEIETFIRTFGGTIYHPVGTAYASSADSKKGVIDNQLRVKGATGLRVVDASVFPYIFSMHPQAPIYIIAERASDLIKEAWSLS